MYFSTFGEFDQAPTKQRILIFFGYSGWDKGSDTGLVEKDSSFHLVALTLKEHLQRRFPTDDIHIICAWHKNTFVKELIPVAGGASLPKIRQIHYVGHGAGGGLFFGFQNKLAMDARQALLVAFNVLPVVVPDAAKRVQALLSDAGLLTGFFTDALATTLLARIKSQFTAGTLMQIWGCFSGKPQHTFDNSNAYWSLFNAAGAPMDGVARHLAKALGIQATAVYDPKEIHGMDFCLRDAAGKFNCKDKRKAIVPTWLWPSSKTVRWVTYDAAGTGDEKSINFLGTRMAASNLPGGLPPPAWFTKELPLDLVKKRPPAFPSCTAVPVTI